MMTGYVPRHYGHPYRIEASRWCWLRSQNLNHRFGLETMIMPAYIAPNIALRNPISSEDVIVVQIDQSVVMISKAEKEMPG